MEILCHIMTMLLGILSPSFYWKDKWRPYVELGSSFYLDVVNSSEFVTKTDLWFPLLTDNSSLPIQQKWTCWTLFYPFLWAQLTKKKRLQTFQRRKIYQGSPEFVKQTFGSYPVLYVDFKKDYPVRNYDDAVDILAVKVHESFEEHSFLVSSDNLDDEEKSLVKRWCDIVSYIEMPPKIIMCGLKNLGEFM